MKIKYNQTLKEIEIAEIDSVKDKEIIKEILDIIIEKKIKEEIDVKSLVKDKSLLKAYEKAINDKEESDLTEKEINKFYYKILSDEKKNKIDVTKTVIDMKTIIDFYSNEYKSGGGKSLPLSALIIYASLNSKNKMIKKINDKISRECEFQDCWSTCISLEDIYNIYYKPEKAKFLLEEMKDEERVIFIDMADLFYYIQEKNNKYDLLFVYKKDFDDFIDFLSLYKNKRNLKELADGKINVFDLIKFLATKYKGKELKVEYANINKKFDEYYKEFIFDPNRTWDKEISYKDLLEKNVIYEDKIDYYVFSNLKKLKNGLKSNKDGEEKDIVEFEIYKFLNYFNSEYNPDIRKIYTDLKEISKEYSDYFIIVFDFIKSFDKNFSDKRWKRKISIPDFINKITMKITSDKNQKIGILNIKDFS
ncbi:MAG: hypothetical protein IJ772_05540 [Bacilli bacterium]|nr:hypothetical protein [Bacilli bacterium]